MATKKQRKRRDKERRHEWEYVYVDDEGREVPVDEAESGAAKPKKAEQTAKRSTSSRGGRAGRKVEPPSWRRVLRRAAIFAPLMLIVVYLLQSKGNKSIPTAVVQTVFLIVVFIPFSYFMDSILYRSYRRRTGEDGGTKPKR